MMGERKTCNNCGFESQRINGRNWRYGLCAKCAKHKHYKDYQKSIKCKLCDNKTTHPNLKCWKKYGLCGVCVKKEYPKEYPNKLFKPSYYKVCPKCSNVIQKLYFNKNNIYHKNLNLYVCSICTVIYDMGCRFKIIKLSDILEQTLINN